MEQTVNSQFSFYLSHSSEADVVTHEQGNRFRKEVIRAGRWYVPHMDLWLDVTMSRMDAWVGQFEGMQANGVKVDLTIDHEQGAEAKRGEIVALFREGGSLYMDVEIADEDTRQLLDRCPEVSIELQAGFVDGNGQAYGEALTAVSIVRQPVLPAQSGFEPVLMGLQHDRPALYFSRELDVPQSDLSLQIEMNAQSDEAAFDALVSAGCITPAVRNELVSSLIGDMNDRQVVCLTAKNDHTPSITKSVLAALKQNKAVQFGTQSLSQAVTLDNKAARSSAEKLTQQMIDEANRLDQVVL